MACYFMHLISEKQLIYAVLAITAIMFVGAAAAARCSRDSNGYWIHP